MIEQNADIKGEISCLKQEFKTEKLRGILISHQLEATEEEVNELEDRVQELENHQNECIEDGDNIYY